MRYLVSEPVTAEKYMQQKNMPVKLRKLERLIIYSFLETKHYISTIRRLSTTERRITHLSEIACQSRNLSIKIPFHCNFEAQGPFADHKLITVLEDLN